MAANLRKEVLLNLTKKKTIEIRRQSSSSSFEEDENFDNYDDYQSEAENDDEDEEEKLQAYLSKSKSFAISEPVIQSLHIIGHSLSANHVFYEVEVTTVTTRWTILKRLSQFTCLNKFVATNFPNYDLTTPFPGWEFGDPCRSGESKGTGKAVKLDAWLQQLLSFPDLMWCWEVRNFFGVPSAQVLIKGTKNKDSKRGEGYLYVKIVAAADLPTKTEGRLPNVFVRTYVADPLTLTKNDTPATQLSTQTSYHNVNPIFNNEFLFTVSDASRPLKFEIWDRRRNRVLKDNFLGHTQVTPSALPPRKAQLIKLKLSSSGQDSKLIVEAMFTPLPTIPKVVNARLPRLRFHVAQARVYPGRECEGTLIFNVGPSKQISQIVLRFIGLEQTNWVQGLASESATDIGQTNTFMDHSIVCWASKPIGGGAGPAMPAAMPGLLGPPQTQSTKLKAIAPGTYVWPFRFTIPENAPPTHSSPNGSITYALRAEAQGTGFRGTKRAGFEVAVLSSPSSYRKSTTSKAPKPALMSNKSRRFIFTARLDDPVAKKTTIRDLILKTDHTEKTEVPQGGFLRTNLQFDQNPLLIGGNHTITVTVTNKSKTIVTDIAVALVSEIHYRANAATSIHKFQHFTVGLAGRGYPIAEGKSATTKMKITLASSMSPSLDESVGATLIEVKYKLLIVYTFREEIPQIVSADFPITLTHKPLMSGAFSSANLFSNVKAIASPVSSTGNIHAQSRLSQGAAHEAMMSRGASVAKLVYVPTIETAIPEPRSDQFTLFAHAPNSGKYLGASSTRSLEAKIAKRKPQGVVETIEAGVGVIDEKTIQVPTRPMRRFSNGRRQYSLDGYSSAASGYTSSAASGYASAASGYNSDAPSNSSGGNPARRKPVFRIPVVTGLPRHTSNSPSPSQSRNGSPVLPPRNGSHASAAVSTATANAGPRKSGSFRTVMLT